MSMATSGSTSPLSSASALNAQSTTPDDTDSGTVKTILVVRSCDCGIQGPENLILALSDRLAKQQVRYVVANLWDGEPPVLALHEEMIKRGGESHILRTRSGMSPGIIFQLAALVKRVQPDVIHTHDVKAEFAALAANFGRGRPLLGSYYGRLQLVSTFLRAADLARFATFRRFHRVLANSEAQRAELHRFGMPKRLVDLLPSFVDTQTHHAPSEHEIAKARLELGIDPSRVVLATVARLAVNKGHTYMLQALREVVAKHPEVLYLVPGEGDMHWRGEGGLRGELEREAASLGLQNHVRFLGYVPNVKVVLDATDLLVSPSLLEGMQVALLEAMASGLPIVATNIGGTPDAVTDGQTGMLVPPANPSALASAVLAMLSDQARMKAMGRAGRQRVMERFDVQVVTDDFLRHCREIARRA
ncbi:MAG: glycosyltransferase family 4 protein [Pirellulaceae bacterium]|nr:glycosyltransferase family 4 protein [Pirellulaceae bacterium]